MSYDAKLRIAQEEGRKQAWHIANLESLVLRLCRSLVHHGHATDTVQEQASNYLRHFGSRSGILRSTAIEEAMTKEPANG